MELTVLGSGGPIPHLDRAGAAFALDLGPEPVLVDCGPGTVHRLMASSLVPAAFERVFFTHQHMDHNAAFFHFAVAGWMLGRRSLTLYGPAGTERLVEALESVYREDLAYRGSLGRSLAGIEDIDCVETCGGFEVQIAGVQVTVQPVEHSIETHAFRFEDLSAGTAVVFSGDTRRLKSLAGFAAGADVLVHDAAVGPTVAVPPAPAWEPFLDRDEAVRDRLHDVHSTPAEAGQVAAEAGVDTLVLNHLSPYADVDSYRRDAEAAFGGRVVVAEDGTRVAPGG